MTSRTDLPAMGAPDGPEVEDFAALFDDDVPEPVLKGMLERVRRDPAAAALAARLLYTDALLEDLRARVPAAVPVSTRRLAAASSSRHSRVQPAVPAPFSRRVAVAWLGGLAAACALVAASVLLVRDRAGDPAVERRMRESNRLRQECVGLWLRESDEAAPPPVAATPVPSREVADRFPTPRPARPAEASRPPAPPRTYPPPAAAPPAAVAPPVAPGLAGRPEEPGTADILAPPAPGRGTREAVVVALLEGTRGVVYTLTDRGAVPVAAGQKLLSGQQIQTGSDGRATIRYADGTRIDLEAVTAVALLDPNLMDRPERVRFGRGVFLFEGGVSADVAKQPADRPMVLVTSHARVDVLGTSLNVREISGGTRIEVLKGLVRATRRADKADALVGAGQFAVAAPGIVLDAKPLLTDRLLLWLRLDEETGNVAFDASAFGLPVRRVGGRWRPREGRVGGAIDLDGRRDYLWCPDYPKPAARMTCAAWVLARSRPTWATILKNWSDDPVRGQIHLGLQQDDGDLECGLREADGGEVRLREGAGRPFPLNAWQHVAVVADGTSVLLYRNGVVVDRGSYDGTINTAFAPLGIGIKPNREGTGPLTEPGNPEQRWDGLIDEVRLYDRDMCEAEIRILASEGR
jgi:hypothetical protein